MTNTLIARTATSVFSRRTALRYGTIAAAGIAAMTLGGTAFADDDVTDAPDTDTDTDFDPSADTFSTGKDDISENVAAAGSTTAGGYTKPTAATTGVKAGTKLTVHKGDIIITKAGTVIENQDIYGFIKIRAANVVIRNCRVRGSGPGGSNTGLIDCNHKNVKNALIEYCTLTPDHPSVWLDGVIGKEYTAHHCNVYNTVDGFGIYNVSDKKAPANVKLEKNYVHDLAYFSKDPNHGGGATHNDCVQIQGGSNITIRGNNFQGFLSKTAGTQNMADRRWCQGILIQPNLAPITNSDISYNWFDGCKVHMYFTTKGGKSQKFGQVKGNRSGTNQYGYEGRTSFYQIRAKKGVTFTNPLSDNVFDATGAAFKEGKTGGIRWE